MLFAVSVEFLKIARYQQHRADVQNQERRQTVLNAAIWNTTNDQDFFQIAAKVEAARVDPSVLMRRENAVRCARLEHLAEKLATRIREIWLWVGGLEGREETPEKSDASTANRLAKGIFAALETMGDGPFTNLVAEGITAIAVKAKCTEIIQAIDWKALTASWNETGARIPSQNDDGSDRTLIISGV